MILKYENIFEHFAISRCIIPLDSVRGGTKMKNDSSGNNIPDGIGDAGIGITKVISLLNCTEQSILFGDYKITDIHNLISVTREVALDVQNKLDCFESECGI